MPKLFESQRPLSPPPASAGLLGGGCGFRGGGCKCKMSPAKGGVNLVCCFPFLPTSRYTPLSSPPPRGHVCVCQGWGHPDCSHCSCVSGYQACLCGFTHPSREGAQSWEGPWRPCSASQHRPQQATRGNGMGGGSQRCRTPHRAPATSLCACPAPGPVSLCVCSSEQERE